MADTSERSGTGFPSSDRSSSNDDAQSVEQIVKGAVSQQMLSYTKTETQKLQEAIKQAAKDTETRLKSNFQRSSKKDLAELKKELSQTLKDYDDKVEDVKSNTIVALGIFAALFTFISVDIQIFKENVSVVTSTGLVLVMLGSLLLFVLVLILFLNRIAKSVAFYILLVTCLILIFAGCLIVSFGEKETIIDFSQNYYNRSEIQAFIAQDNASSSEATASFKKCILMKGLYPCLNQ